VRLVAECRADHGSEWEAMRSVAQKLGIGTTERGRKWVRRAEVDAGARPRVTSEESAELRRLRAENRELRRAHEILKAAAGCFAAELDPRVGRLAQQPPTAHRLPRPDPRPSTSRCSTVNTRRRNGSRSQRPESPDSPGRLGR
jgi:transposase